jgi:hypothetical protein
MPKTSKSSSPTVRKVQEASIHPTTGEIALRAYHIYLERGCASGNALEDWIRAESELQEESSRPRRKPAPKSIAA